MIEHPKYGPPLPMPEVVLAGVTFRAYLRRDGSVVRVSNDFRLETGGMTYGPNFWASADGVRINTSFRSQDNAVAAAQSITAANDRRHALGEN